MPLTGRQERLNVSMVKDQSRKLVFLDVFRHGPITRADIAGSTGLSQGTVKTVIDEFLAAGIVEEKTNTTTTVGRKPRMVTLKSRSRCLGILEISSGLLEFCYLDLSLEPVGSPHRESVPADTDFAKNLTLFLENLPPPDTYDVGPLAGIGVVAPGPYDEQSDSVTSLQIAGIRDVPVAGIIRTVLDLPIAVGEDVHLAALAEAGPPHSARQPLFFLYISRGIGGAYLSDGRILTGAGDMAGEIGQMVMSDGRRLEETVSWTAFRSAMGIPAETGDTEARRLIESKLANNGDARSLFDVLVKRLAVALSHAVCLFNPRSLILGGAFEFLGDRFLAPLESALRELLIDAHRTDLEVSTSRHVAAGMTRGAGMLILERWLETEFVS